MHAWRKPDSFSGMIRGYNSGKIHFMGNVTTSTIGFLWRDTVCPANASAVLYIGRSFEREFNRWNWDSQTTQYHRECFQTIFSLILIQPAAPSAGTCFKITCH